MALECIDFEEIMLEDRKDSTCNFLNGVFSDNEFCEKARDIILEGFYHLTILDI